MASGILYRNIVKPLLFRFPADDVHDFFLHTGEKLGTSGLVRSVVAKTWAYRDPILSQSLHGLTFPNPVGLSAGFDYEASLVDITASLGFGFHTVGTLSHEAYGGNPRPMLGRLPKSQSLLVNKGFKNLGVTRTLSKVKSMERPIPIGVSIGATNKPYATFDDMITDAFRGFQDANAFDVFDYYELNISCPNLTNIQNLPERFDSPRGFRAVLERIQTINFTKPLFVKMPLERPFSEIRPLLDIASDFPFVKGFIFSNLAKDRTNAAFDAEEIKKAGVGNFSGRPVARQSNELIRSAYSEYGKRFTIIGVGGVFTAEDAYQKITLGASLVQMITGMIYMGPQQIGVINKGLAKLLRRDGFAHLSEAIGAAA